MPESKNIFKGLDVSEERIKDFEFGTPEEASEVLKEAGIKDRVVRYDNLGRDYGEFSLVSADDVVKNLLSRFIDENEEIFKDEKEDPSILVYESEKYYKEFFKWVDKKYEDAVVYEGEKIKI